MTDIILPLDFGVENLDCPVHGNIQVNLQDGQQLRANSMVLALQSPGMRSAFFDLQQSSLDVQDFSNTAAREFFEALYSGRVTLTQENFREIHKMSRVFAVEWLSQKCRVYFFGVLEPVRVTMEHDAEGGVDLTQLMDWMLKEALHTQQVLKCSELLDAAVEDLSQLSNSLHVGMFLKHCLKEFGEVKHCLLYTSPSPRD